MEEAHSGTPLCAASRTSEHLARCTRSLTYAHSRTPLEYCIKTANQARAAWLLNRCGAQALVWAPPPAPQYQLPRWNLALFDAPPLQGEPFFVERRKEWRVPDARAWVRALLTASTGGSAPHGGFIMPPALDFNFGGFGPPIVGPLAAWRAANPGALVANVQGRHDLRDADFVHLRGVRALTMRSCNQAALTDAAFAHLRGLHTLNMHGCNQAGVTSAAFAHLRGIHTLDMMYCNQAALGDGIFEPLVGIHTLYMGDCNQATITGAGMHHLRGIRLLYMTNCRPAAIAAARALGFAVTVR